MMESSSMVVVSDLNHTGVTVSNIDREFAFYRDVVGLQVVSEPTSYPPSEELGLRLGVPGASIRTAMFRVGNGNFELVQYLTPEAPFDRPAPPHAVGGVHVAFQVENIEEVYEAMRSKGVEFLSDIKVETGVNEGWRWVYFRDPDGLVMELMQYSPPQR